MRPRSARVPIERSIVRSLLAAIAFGANFAGTCIPNAYSPPATLGPLEQPGEVGPGEQTVGGHFAPVSVHVGGILGDYGASLVSGGALARQSLRRAPVELSETFTVIHVGNEGDASVHRNGYALRLGVMRGFERMLSVHGGLGGGYTKVGSFVTPDIGLTFGLKNPYVIPLMTLDGGISVPVRTRPFVVDDGDEVIVDRELPTSYFVRFAPGFAVPLGAWRSGAPVFTLTVRFVLGAVGSELSSDGFIGFGSSLDVRFGRDERAPNPYRPRRRARREAPPAPTPLPGAQGHVPEDERKR